MEYLVHFVVAFCLGILSSMSGGGGGLIMTPYLLIWGIPPTTVIGSGKIGAIGLALGATREFRKAKLIETKFVKKLVILSGITAVIGANLVFTISERTLELIVGSVVMIISATMLYFLIHGLGLRPRQRTSKHISRGYIAYTATSVVQSAIGAGIGVLNSLILIGMFGMTALQALATKRMVNIVTLSISGAIFALRGVVDWKLAAVLLLANIFASTIGTKIAIAKGNRFVMVLQVIAGFTMSAIVLLK